MISQTMNLLRSKLDRPLVAQPFSSLSAHKSIKQHEKIGKLLGIDTTKLSADGQTLTVESKGPKPAGGTYDNTVVFQRVSGSSGIIGKWKTKNMKSSSPETIELAASGADGLMFKSPDFSMISGAQFDGKDYPVTGPTLAAGWTLAVRKAGERAFEMTVKQNGKPLYQMTFTASADGKTLTENGSPVGVNEKYKAVYDRQ